MQIDRGAIYGTGRVFDAKPLIAIEQGRTPLRHRAASRAAQSAYESPGGGYEAVNRNNAAGLIGAALTYS